MPVDPRPPIGGHSGYSHVLAPPPAPAGANDRAVPGFEAALVEASAAPAAAASLETAAPADRRGMDGRDRTRQFVDRQPVAGTDGGSWLFGEDGFGFDDLLDIINPLQHIPIVSAIYRRLTGDEISPAAEMAGGALFGGPLGLAGSVANMVVDETTGRDLGEHAMAMVFGETGEAGASPEAGNMASVPAPEPLEEARTRAERGPTASQVAAADTTTHFIALERRQSAGAAAQFRPVAAAAPSAAAPPPAADVATDPAEPPETGTVEAVIAEDMMLALDKYEALLRSRAVAQPPGRPAAGSLYDTHI